MISNDIPVIIVCMRRMLHSLLLRLLLRIKHLLLLMIRLLVQTCLLLLLLDQVSLHCLLLMDSIGSIMLVWVKVWMGLMLLSHQILGQLGRVFRAGG